MITESNSNFLEDFLCERDPPARNHKLFICVQGFLQSSKWHSILCSVHSLFQPYSWLTPTSLRNSTLPKFALWDNKEKCITVHPDFNCSGKLFFPKDRKKKKMHNRPGSFFSLQDCWKMPFWSTQELSAYSPGICIGFWVKRKKIRFTSLTEDTAVRHFLQ